jgi:hypothetical protein
VIRVTASRLVHEVLERAALGALAVLIVAGSVFTWIGVPLAGLYLAAKVTTEPARVLVLALAGIPSAMVVFGFLLFRLGRVYETLRGPGDRRPLVDVALVASAWTAVVVMAVWFFVFAELRLVSP